MTEQPEVPLGAERERVIARLSEAFAQDQLEVEEFERRVSLAYEARATAALVRLTRDLPAAAAPPALRDEPPAQIASVLSSVVRRGPSVVPRRLELRSWAGNLELDLREAAFSSGVTEIAVDVVLGNVELRLPHGVEVENTTRAILASFEARHPGRPQGAPPLVSPRAVLRFTGRVVLGNVTVRVS
jgi:hypothetical protein